MKQNVLRLWGMLPVLGILFVFSSCASIAAAGTPVNTHAIDSITIYNIPLTVNGQPAYKVYIHVTNSMSQYDDHLAQGTALLEGQTSVTVKMYAPPPDYRGKDPDEHGEPWSGAAGYFSVVISPQNAPNIDSILVRAGQPFNKDNQECDFNSLIRVSESSLLRKKTEAVFNEIIRADKQGIGTDVMSP